MHDQTPTITHAPSQVALSESFWTWCRVAALSFGGPAGQIAVMHRIIVDEKKWISEERFLHALNYCMLLPGPEAQQLATYIGWLMHRSLGGLMAGILFVLPGFAAILALSILYACYGESSIVQALFFGLKPAVMAIVMEAVLRIGKRVLKNTTMITLAIASFIAIFFLGIPFPILIVKPGEMLDGLGMAETTPGPLIMVVQFVGFLGAYRNPGPFSPLMGGIVASVLTTWVTFVPCFLWVFLGAPYIERLRGNKRLNSALSAITAAVVGIVLNLAVWFSLHTLFGRVITRNTFGLRLQIPDFASADLAACSIAALACLLTFYWKKGLFFTLGASVIAGAALHLLRS